MRKLASIQRIKALEPIPDADSIENATVLGWQLVVKKGEFQVGDLCVYCEVDCLLPDRPEFEFLKNRGSRIRTIRLRGQVSQGICFPLSILPAGTPIEEDLEVTELLDIVKFEPPIPACLAGIQKGEFPSFIPKTDETRVQTLQARLDEYEGQPFFITEKLDGSSVTYFIRDGEFGVCSRNMELEFSEENSLWKVAIEQDIEAKLRSLGGNIAIQGELIGEGVQGNKYKLRGQHAYFFNFFDINAYHYADFEEFKTLFKTLDLKTVPILEQDFVLYKDINKLVEYSRGHSTLYKVHREGLVLRAMDSVGRNNRVSFKVINPDFLLKYE